MGAGGWFAPGSGPDGQGGHGRCGEKDKCRSCERGKHSISWGDDPWTLGPAQFVSVIK
jgi:hypothetical protein